MPAANDDAEEQCEDEGYGRICESEASSGDEGPNTMPAGRGEWCLPLKIAGKPAFMCAAA
jgi:hypothetical protein